MKMNEDTFLGAALVVGAAAIVSMGNMGMIPFAAVDYAAICMSAVGGMFVYKGQVYE